MPQTKQKEEWVNHYKEQLTEFFGKGSGWYVSQSAGNIKLEVISNDKKQSRTLPYEWSKSGFAVAVEEIKQIFKRFQSGKTTTLAAACDITSASNSKTETKWADLFVDYRKFVPQASDKTWKNNYYKTANELKAAKVPPVLNQAETLMNKKKKPSNGTDLMMQALEPWEHGSRARQISRRVLKAFLEWAVLNGKLPAVYAPPPLSAIPNILNKKKIGYALSDLQILSLIEDEPDEKWKYVYQLLATFGLRPAELEYLVVKDDGQGEEVWSMYEKSMGGKKGERTEPRELCPLPLIGADGKAVDFKLLERIKLGEDLPYLGRGGEVAMTMNTRFRRWYLWQRYRKEAEKIKQVCVPYSFRHRYAKASHSKGFPIPNIAESMGHTPEVHMQNYARFKPSGTKEMYKKANELAA